MNNKFIKHNNTLYDSNLVQSMLDTILFPQNLLIIVKGIQNKMQIHNISDYMITDIQNYIKKLVMINLYNKYNNDLDQINLHIIDSYYKFKTVKSKSFDIKEDYLKKKMNNLSLNDDSSDSFTNKVESFNNGNLSDLDLVKIAKIVNYESLWKDVYIYIDTRYQNRSNLDRRFFSFNIVNDTKVKQIGSGAITAIGTIQNIVQFNIVPFTIPYLPEADNYYNRITLTFVELISDCYEAYEDGQFHFSFNAEQVGNLIKLTPDRTEYRFKKPISILNNLTLRFGSPLVPIQFHNDTGIVDNINYLDNSGEITFTTDHNLITGDLIYITLFTTLNNSNNVVLLENINRSVGHNITRVDNLIISINIDFSQIINPDLTMKPNIYFGSKRIMIPLRIQYLLNPTDITDYI